jgi:hypothetical protein
MADRVEMSEQAFAELVRRLVELTIRELQRRGFFGDASQRLH